MCSLEMARRSIETGMLCAGRDVGREWGYMALVSFGVGREMILWHSSRIPNLISHIRLIMPADKEVGS